jgi:transcriptional regulator with XRE-family HTH domain
VFHVEHLGSFGKRLRAARLAGYERGGREIRQTDIAELLDVRGATVSTWEGDQYVPTIDVISRLADILGVTPGWLAFGQEPRYPAPIGFEMKEVALHSQPATDDDLEAPAPMMAYSPAKSREEKSRGAAKPAKKAATRRRK